MMGSSNVCKWFSRRVDNTPSRFAHHTGKYPAFVMHHCIGKMYPGQCAYSESPLATAAHADGKFIQQKQTKKRKKFPSPAVRERLAKRPNPAKLGLQQLADAAQIRVIAEGAPNYFLSLNDTTSLKVEPCKGKGAGPSHHLRTDGYPDDSRCEPA